MKPLHEDCCCIECVKVDVCRDAAGDMLKALERHVRWEAEEDTTNPTEEQAARYMEMMAATVTALRKARECPTCEGDGFNPESTGFVTCRTCGGSGQSKFLGEV